MIQSKVREKAEKKEKMIQAIPVNRLEGTGPAASWE
jgi:hypothetical protein